MKRIQQLLLGLSSMVLVTNVFAYDIYYHGAREQAIKEQFELQGYILEMEAEQRAFIDRQNVGQFSLDCSSNIRDVKEKKWGPPISHKGTQLDLFKVIDSYDKIRTSRYAISELHLPMDARWKKNELKLFQQIPWYTDARKIPENGYTAMIEEPYYVINKNDFNPKFVRLDSFLKISFNKKDNQLVIQRSLSGIDQNGKYHRIAETHSHCGGGDDAKLMTYAQYKDRYAALIKQRGY